MNYLMFNGVKYSLTEENGDGCAKTKGAKLHLADIEVGEVCKVGDWEFIVCEHTSDGTVLLMKDCLYNNEVFGESNDYNGSHVDELCNEFAEKLAKSVHSENIVLHYVDLTADDGRRDYGAIRREVSLFTADQYRRYCEILEEHRVGTWTWTATAHSTPRHENDVWVKCVAPAGDINFNRYFYFGVRPFCILKSNIFVSK